MNVDHKEIPNVELGTDASGESYYFKDLLDETPELQEWLRQLLDENERLQKDLAENVAKKMAAYESIEEWQSIFQAQAKEIERLQKEKETCLETISVNLTERTAMWKELGQLQAEKVAALEAVKLIERRMDMWVTPAADEAKEIARATIKRLGERPKGFESTEIHEPPKEG